MEADGTTEAIHGLLRRKAREQACRSPEPTAAITGARVVKTSSNVPEATQGYDAGKRTKGRKQHIATDTLGLLLAVVITAASVQDTNGGKDVASQLAARHPTVTAGWPTAATRPGSWPAPPKPASPSPLFRKNPVRKASPRFPAGGRRTHLRVACPAPAACPRLRDPPGTFRHDDLLGDDRQHEQAPHRRKHPNLARRPRRNRRTITDLNQMPS